MITHGIVTYNAGEAVRLLTFGVRWHRTFVTAEAHRLNMSVQLTLGAVDS